MRLASPRCRGGQPTSCPRRHHAAGRTRARSSCAARGPALRIGPEPDPAGRAAAGLRAVDFRYRLQCRRRRSSKCGNGARCFVRFVASKRPERRRAIRVETLGRHRAAAGGRRRVTVDMGVPAFEPSRVPFDAGGLVARAEQATGCGRSRSAAGHRVLVLSIGTRTRCRWSTMSSRRRWQGRSAHRAPPPGFPRGGSPLHAGLDRRAIRLRVCGSADRRDAEPESRAAPPRAPGILRGSLDSRSPFMRARRTAHRWPVPVGRC